MEGKSGEQLAPEIVGWGTFVPCWLVEYPFRAGGYRRDNLVRGRLRRFTSRYADPEQSPRGETRRWTCVEHGKVSACLFEQV